MRDGDTGVVQGHMRRAWQKAKKHYPRTYNLIYTDGIYEPSQGTCVKSLQHHHSSCTEVLKWRVQLVLNEGEYDKRVEWLECVF